MEELRYYYHKRAFTNITWTCSTRIANLLVEPPTDFEKAESRTLRGLFFHCINASCPEQYVVYYQGQEVAVIDLDHGWLSLVSRRPKDEGQLWSEQDWLLEPSLGYWEFSSAAKRGKYLNEFAAIIKEKLQP